MKALPDQSIEILKYDWDLFSRDKQRAPTHRPWRTWLPLAGRGWGKALALDTKIPTTDGWTDMKSIKVGDQVFDETGTACTVQAVHEVMLGRECYRVKFSDRSEIVADADHLWLTKTRRLRKAEKRRTGVPSSKPQCQPTHRPTIVTTREIAATIIDAGERNHSIDCAGPLHAPDAVLPIDPYLLGCWLGDGHSAGAAITATDIEIVNEFKRAGYRLNRYKNARESAASSYGIVSPNGVCRCPVSGRMTSGGDGFLHRLRGMDLLLNKHVPAIYLRSSEGQRLAILQGLMDTDGYCDPQGGSSEFCSTRKVLADGVRELALSLGFKAVIYEGRATLNGRDCGPKWRVCFTAHQDRPIFRLHRKIAAQPKRGAQAARAYRRYIVSVDAIESVPVRCITVSSPSQLYLCGESMIATHNTRVGSEWIRTQVEGSTPLARGKRSRIALIGETSSDVRDVMINGPSGILAVTPPDYRPTYIANRKSLVWPNGVEAKVYSGIEPDQLRGPQHEIGWLDELCKFRYAQELWDMFQMGLRLGDNPQALVTTTPRPIKVLKDIVSDPDTVVVKGSTYENSGNLAAGFINYVRRKYEGTRLGRQELEADILSDVIGALWSHSALDAQRRPRASGIERIVVAVDPPTTSGENADECGIIVAGVTGGVRENESHGYVIDDQTSHMETPMEWAKRAVKAYHKYGANCIVAEINQGGEMVETIIRQIDPGVAYKGVHASKGKLARAEPVASLYEQGRVHHVGTFADLEDQMVNFCIDGLVDQSKSPDRVDALVWALTDLMIEPVEAPSLLEVI